MCWARTSVSGKKIRYDRRSCELEEQAGKGRGK
jgi:hypothetical protein